MGRFDRQHTETRDLPAILGNAAEEFRASIEREVRTVLEAAQSRAAELERQAEFNASQREQLSEHRAQQIVDTVFNRASRVLDSIDLVESALSGMLDGLRAELQSLAPHGESEALAPEGAQSDETRREAVEQEAARPEEPGRSLPQPVGEATAQEPAQAAPEAPVAVQTEVAEPPPTEQRGPEAAPEQAEPAPEQAEPAPEAPESGREPAQALPEVEPSSDEGGSTEHATEWQEDQGWPGPVPIKPEAHIGASDEGGLSEFDQMVRRQLLKMRSNGKSRAEAERFLERFHFAGDYVGLLEEAYGDNGAADPPRRRRLFSRLRRRAG